MTKNNYQAWDVKVDEFKDCKNELEKTKFFVKYGILAPSVHNMQPWLFSIDKLSVKISPDYSKSLPQADPEDRFLAMSIGGCAETIEIVAAYFGYLANRRIEADKSVTISLTQSNHQEQRLHPNVITERFSNKFPYKKQKVTGKHLEEVIQEISTKDVRLLLTQEDKTKHQLAELHLSAVTKTMQNKQFVQELVSKLISNNSKSYIGMPGFVIGLSNVQSVVLPKIIHKLPSIMSKKAQEKDRALVEKTAGFGIIYSPTDSYSSIIESGGMYQRMSLLLKSKNIHNSMLTAIVLQDYERTAVGKLLKTNGKINLFFRFGYPENDKTVHTPRMEL